MTRLSELATLVRSKSAGRVTLTIDIIFAEDNHPARKRFARASRPRSGRAVFAARWTQPRSAEPCHWNNPLIVMSFLCQSRADVKPFNEKAASHAAGALHPIDP